MGMVGNNVLQQANNPGTGTFSLIAAPAGRLSWVSQIGTGQQAFYFANDGASVEIGIGTVTAGSPDTLSRDTVLGNSLGTTAKINFTGLVTLTNDVPGQRTIYANPANDAVLMGGRRVSGLVAATAADDAPRLDQVAWRDLGTYVVSSGAIYAPLPTGYSTFRITGRSLVPTAETFMYVRFSTDNGATYHAAAADYTFQALALANTILSTSYNQTSYLQTTGNTVTTFGARFSMELDLVSNEVDVQSLWYSDASGSPNPGLSMGRFAGYYGGGGAPNYVVVGAAGSSSLVTGGSVRLEGRI